MADHTAPLTEAPEAEADRVFHAALGRLTGGLSPAALAEAWTDWATHLAAAPSRSAELARKVADLPSTALARTASTADDVRFNAPEWRRWPFNVMAGGFLAAQDWWDTATAGLHGVAPAHARLVHFGARQWLDLMAPSNYLWTNPVALDRTVEERGANLQRGLRHWQEDLAHLASGRAEADPDYRVGETVATTPGEVVFRNRLIELIRYTPVTPEVKAEPLLIVPAWIMKYYILDLSPANSMVGYLLSQGFEVYMISWKNPDAGDADLSMDDYVDLGIRAALDAIEDHLPGQKVHAAGYCLGGTLLSIAAAAMARDGQERLASITLMAAQTDFSEAGEITLFISEAQVAFLEDIMAEQGYLKADQMAGAFRMLRSNDLIWSRVVRHYLLGERTEMNDLMAWNADATRLPARMHSEYLRHLFLENALALGHYHVGGRQVALEDIDTPLFVIGTEADHVSPWRSVWKIGRLTQGPMRFLLTNSGHNAGILSEPGHRHRHYRTGEVTEHALSPDDWVAATPAREGSWWPEWAGWLDERSSGQRRPAPQAPALGPAPGTYVLIP